MPSLSQRLARRHNIEHQLWGGLQVPIRTLYPCMAQVRTERQHMARYMIPRIGTGFQRLHRKPMTEVMQTRARAVRVSVNPYCGKQSSKGLGHGGIPIRLSPP